MASILPRAGNDGELISLIKKKLYTPVVGDILDQMGLFHQFLDPAISPLLPGMQLVGRAMPVLMMDVYGHQEQPFGLLPQALDDLKENEIYIATGAFYRSAAFGELMTAAAKSRGALGAVVDGYHRDTPMVLEQQFPLFSRGAFAQDSGPRMKIADFRLPIEFGSVSIVPGDLVFGDRDGVLIIPRKVEREVLERALEKASTEKIMRRAIEEGMSVHEAFDTYGVL
jgi:4-hydroxy-4-methyl-2-oxoglutarate aldolase